MIPKRDHEATKTVSMQNNLLMTPTSPIREEGLAAETNHEAGSSAGSGRFVGSRGSR